MKQETKFELVASDLTKMENTAFYCSPLITATNLKSKWTRMAKQFGTKAGLLSEGSNLSGLAEPTEVEKLMNTMLQGKAAQKADREALTKKEKIRDGKMLTHENACINMHGIPLTLSKQLTPSKVSSYDRIPITIITIVINRLVRRFCRRQQSPRKRSHRNNHLFLLSHLSNLITALKFSMH